MWATDDISSGFLPNPNFVLHILMSYEVWKDMDTPLRVYLLNALCKFIHPQNPSATFNAITLVRLVSLYCSVNVSSSVLFR